MLEHVCFNFKIVAVLGILFVIACGCTGNPEGKQYDKSILDDLEVLRDVVSEQGPNIIILPGDYVLISAIRYKKEKAFNYLISQRELYINAQGGWSKEKPLYVAVQSGKHYVDKLLDRGVDLNNSCGSSSVPICKAAILGDIAVVESLLSAGADVNCVDDNGRTALHYSAVGGNVMIFKYLLNAGASTNVVDRYGMTLNDYILSRPSLDEKVKEELISLLQIIR